MKIVDALRFGKMNIISRGWCQFDDKVFDPTKEHGCCVASALPYCGGTEDDVMAPVRLFKRANGIDPNMAVGHWNDDPARTKEEVLAAYDKAITLAEQENL